MARTWSMKHHGFVHNEKLENDVTRYKAESPPLQKMLHVWKLRKRIHLQFSFPVLTLVFFFFFSFFIWISLMQKNQYRPANDADSNVESAREEDRTTKDLIHPRLRGPSTRTHETLQNTDSDMKSIFKYVTYMCTRRYNSQARVVTKRQLLKKWLYKILERKKDIAVCGS